MRRIVEMVRSGVKTVVPAQIVRFQVTSKMAKPMPMLTLMSPMLAMEARRLVSADRVVAVTRPKLTTSCLRWSGPNDYSYCQNSGY